MNHSNFIIYAFKILYFNLFLLVFISIDNTDVKAQQADQLIRIAEMGELVDSVNVWGDINRAGRYLVPEGTNLTQLISYGMGYNTLRGREAELDWSKVILEVKVSRLNEQDRMIEVAFFRYAYHDPEPIEMFEFEVQNNDIVTLQMRRRPSFRDYLSVISPALSALATSILLIERLSRD
jgi:hypothetical protein